MWAQVISAILGIWLMASPAILGLSGDKTISNNAHIVGPIIASFAIIAWWEVTQVVRHYNILPAIWLLLAPWVLNYDATPAILNDMVVGATVLGLSFVRTKTEGAYGGGWSAIWKRNALHATEAGKQTKD